MLKKFYYVYKTTCIITAKFYIGVHSTDELDDGYKGSGKILLRSIKKYGSDNHKTRILEFLSSKQEMYHREAQIVNEELLQNSMCMNLTLGGYGGNKIVWNDENRKLQALRFKNNIRTPEHNKKIAESNKNNLLSSEKRRQHMTKMNIARKLTDEQKDKINEENKRLLIDKCNTRERFLLELKNRNIILENNKFNRCCQVMIKSDDVLLNSLIKYTQYLPSNSSVGQRLYHMFHNIEKLPRCPVCGNEIDKFYKLAYQKFCGQRCACKSNLGRV
jgi:hypothetical protein